MDIIIRDAAEKDSDQILRLLRDIARIHSEGRPDIFKKTQKYDNNDLRTIINDPQRRIFVAADGDVITGYIFCIIKTMSGNPLHLDSTTLYIDDLCVDGQYRKKGIGGMLFDKAVAFADEIKADRLELNVWNFNENAKRFYTDKGFTVQRSILELDPHTLRLAFPSLEDEAEVMAYRREFLDSGAEHIDGGAGLEKYDDYSEWLTKLRTDLTRDDGRLVPSTELIGIVGSRVVGVLQIRHKLNDFLMNYGGHIGYSVRPSERRKGYASSMLRLALNKCKDMGIYNALVTCDKENEASSKTILHCGGIMENEVQEGLSYTQRYWINLK